MNTFIIIMPIYVGVYDIVFIRDLLLTIVKDLVLLNLFLMIYKYLFQLFYSFFKSLVGKDVVVELKNDLR